MASSSTPVDFTKSIDLKKINGKTILITGGADGIGFGIAKACAENGAYVIIADINQDLGSQRVKEMGEKGHPISFIQTDVSSFSSQQSAFQHALTLFPTSTISIVIANAGIAGGSILPSAFLTGLSSHDTLPEPSTAAIDVNVKGTYYTAVLALHYFSKGPKTDSKQLILLGSMASYIVEPTALTTAYTSSKFFVRGLFKSLRYATEAQLGYDLRCNHVVPAWVDTKMMGTSSGALSTAGIKVASVEDVVAVVLRVLSDESVRGRSLGVTPGGVGTGEAAGFDMEDDPKGQDGGSVVWKIIGEGSVFGEIVKKVLGYGRWFGV